MQQANAYYSMSCPDRIKSSHMKKNIDESAQTEYFLHCNFTLETHA